MDFLMKPSRAQWLSDWTWFSTTGIQQLHQNQHLLQTVCTGRTRYISRELRIHKWPPITTHHLSCHGRPLRQMEPEVMD